MEPTKRVVVNTIAQHIRAIVNTLLSLYSTRLILDALGNSDYGIYTLIAGVVALLGFVNNAMLVTTQRYISYYTGQNALDYVKIVFKNSLFLHLIFSVILGIVLFSIKDILVCEWLKIDPSRHQIAIDVCICSAVMLITSILSAPFKALFISRENIVYISIIEICDGILKLIIALSLLRFAGDKLLLYASLMVCIQLLNLLSFAIYALIKYPECSICIRIRDLNKQCQKQISGFAFWTIYSMGCIVGRSQGLQIVFNRFYGTILNSAYGIAMQVHGSVQFLAQAIFNAMNPQIMKAEGSGDRNKMLHLSANTSKYAFLLLSIVAIPLIIEMPSILSFWLKSVPDHTLLFCRVILIAAVCDQLTLGLGSANQAVGNIRNYSLIVNTMKILTLPAACLLLNTYNSVEYVMWCYLILEILSSIVRLFILKYSAGLSIYEYVKTVFLPVIMPTCCSVCVGFLMTCIDEFPFRFVLTTIICMAVEFVIVYYFVLSFDERRKILNVLAKWKK